MVPAVTNQALGNDSQPLPPATKGRRVIHYRIDGATLHKKVKFFPLEPS